VQDLTTPDPLLEVAIGTIGLTMIIFVHGAGIRMINRRFSDAWVQVTPRRRAGG
jgi:hypothetical protein